MCGAEWLVGAWLGLVVYGQSLCLPSPSGPHTHWLCFASSAWSGLVWAGIYNSQSPPPHHQHHPRHRSRRV
mgnify:CR=1 FL=1